MMTKRLVQGIVATIAAGFLIAVLLVQLSTPAAAQAGAETLTFEVAENGFTFTFDDAPVFEDGFPA